MRLLSLLVLAASAAAQTPQLKDALAALPFRQIGPANMGGRIDDIAVVESDPRIMYVGSAAGGVFKTTNAGVTWTPLTDKLPNSTIGDIAIAPSDPSINSAAITSFLLLQQCSPQSRYRARVLEVGQRASASAA